MNIEDQLRNRVSAAWVEFQSSEDGSKAEVQTFRQYCEALDEASQYAAEQVKLTQDGQSRNVMKTALRVLAAINERQTPSGSDLERLRECVLNAGDRAADDLACEVIQTEMRRRAKARSVTGS